jgi:hypothetical protein
MRKWRSANIIVLLVECSTINLRLLIPNFVTISHDLLTLLFFITRNCRLLPRLGQLYSTGFGNLSGEFWLGLEKIHRLTKSENVTLRIDMEDFNGVLVYAEYDLFLVGDVSENFILTVGSFEGICLQC